MVCFLGVSTSTSDMSGKDVLALVEEAIESNVTGTEATPTVALRSSNHCTQLIGSHRKAIPLARKLVTEQQGSQELLSILATRRAQGAAASAGQLHTKLLEEPQAFPELECLWYTIAAYWTAVKINDAHLLVTLDDIVTYVLVYVAQRWPLEVESQSTTETGNAEQDAESDPYEGLHGNNEAHIGLSFDAMNFAVQRVLSHEWELLVRSGFRV